MKINWRIRLRNKLWLTTLLATLCTFVYDLLTLLDVTPPLPEETLTEAISTVLTLLTALGVIIDPTTPGPSDSPRALEYE